MSKKPKSSVLEKNGLRTKHVDIHSKSTKSTDFDLQTFILTTGKLLKCIYEFAQQVTGNKQSNLSKVIGKVQNLRSLVIISTDEDEIRVIFREGLQRSAKSIANYRLRR